MNEQQHEAFLQGIYDGMEVLEKDAGLKNIVGYGLRKARRAGRIAVDKGRFLAAEVNREARILQERVAPTRKQKLLKKMRERRDRNNDFRIRLNSAMRKRKRYEPPKVSNPKKRLPIRSKK